VEIVLKDRGNRQYAIRLAVVFMLVSIFITPSLIMSVPALISRSQSSAAATGVAVQPIDVDPALTKLINNQTTSNVKVIVVFRDEAGVSSIEKSSGLDNIFKLITTFTIIPAALIEGPADRMSELFSDNQIRSLYLNKEIDLPQLNATLSPVASESSATPKDINETPSSIANGSGVIVAVCDSGIDTTNPDLTGKVIANTSFVNTMYGYLDNESDTDDLGHGTYVAGIIAGSGVVDPLYQGVAPAAKLIDAKCIDAFGRGFTAGIIAAMQWANATGADVINLSLGGGAADPNDPMSLAVDSVVRSGVVVAVAAGNGGPYYSTGGVPGAARLGISVGAANETTSIASFSSRGPTLDGRPYPDVLAPGVDIISDLASGSAIANYANRLGLALGNYVPLSGTSAATPIVSGAAALLLSATGLRQLNRSTVPHDSLIEIASTIKVALMSTTKSLGADVNSQGSGMIDVYSAYEFLYKFGSRIDYPIVKVSPSQLINPPYSVGYLGDSVESTVSIMTASKTNLTVVCSGNATSLLRFSNLSFTNIVGQTSLEVNVTVPGSTMLGRYTAQIGFENETSLLPGENVSVSFNVKNPKGRIYIDLFHTDSSFSTESTMYKFGSMLENRGYSIYESNDPITYSKLSQYDVLILIDPLIMFSVEETKAIHEFVANNGSLLVLGNDYPDIASEAVNNITAQYGIEYTRNFTAIYSDLALAEIVTSVINITNLASHPVTAGVGEYLFGYGSTLSVSSPAISVAFAPPDFRNLPVLAIDEVPGGGRIVATGSLLFATDDSLLDPTYPGNLKLAQNIIDWLVAGRNASVEIFANRTRVKTNEPFQIGIAVTNRTNPNGEPIAANVTCTASNGTSYPITLQNYTNRLYYNTSIKLQTEGNYAFDVDAKVLGQEIKRSFSIELINNPPQITNISLATHHIPSNSYPLPTYLESFLSPGTPIIDRYGDYVNITVRATGLSENNSEVTIYMTRSPTFYLPNDKPLTYFALTAEPLNATTYRAQFQPKNDSGADVYLYWISADNNSFTSSFNQVNAIMVASIDPQISNTTTTVNSQPLTALRQQVGNSLQISPISASVGSTISIVINGSDSEENISKMKAWAVLLDPNLYIVPGIVDAELVVSKIPFNSTTRTFQGGLTIPANGSAFIPGTNTSLPLTNMLFYIMIVLADSSGAYSTDFAGVNIIPVTHPIQPQLIFLILGISIAIPLVIIALIEIRTRKKVKEGPVYYPYSEPEHPAPQPQQ
jgi:subtilisin family serine protease